MEKIFVWDNGWHSLLGERTQMDIEKTEWTDDELDEIAEGIKALAEKEANEQLYAVITDRGHYFRLIIEDRLDGPIPRILWSGNYERKSIAVQECADYGIDPEEIEYA